MSTIHPLSLSIPFPVKTVNCYYIEDSTPTLIDCGINSNKAFDELRAGVEHAGGKLSRVKRILLTHGHADHMGLAGRIAAMGGARVLVHPWDLIPVHESGEKNEAAKSCFRQFLIEGGADEPTAFDLAESIFHRLRDLVAPLEEFTVIEGGEVIPFDGFELRVIRTPGHSPGSVSFLSKQAGILFSGDSLIEEIIANPAMEAQNMWDASSYRGLASYEASLDAIDALALKKVFPGHGPTLSDPGARVEHLRLHHRLRSEAVLQILKEHEPKKSEASGMTPLMVAQTLFKSLGGVDVFHGICGARCHLEFLEDQGKIGRESGGGRHYYRWG